MERQFFLTSLKIMMEVVAVQRENVSKNCGMKFMIKNQSRIFGYKSSKHQSKARKSHTGSAKSPQRNTKQPNFKMKNLSLFYERGLYPTQTLEQGFVNLFNVARTKSAIDFFIRYVRLFLMREGKTRSAMEEDKRIFSYLRRRRIIGLCFLVSGFARK